jgi:hypothetical protein
MKYRHLYLRITILGMAFLGCMAGVKVAASQSTGTSSSSIWIRVNDDDTAVTYSAQVQSVPNAGCYDQDMHSSNGLGQWCKFSFTGTGVKWIGGKNADHGKADVYLDGKLDATVDTTASPGRAQQELYVKTGLSDGPHLLMIQVKNDGYQNFDAFEYLIPRFGHLAAGVDEIAGDFYF